jgi:4-hydroxybenzoate polyprenyltransferase
MNLRFFHALLELARPLEWTKSFANMALGSVLAFYLVTQTFDATIFLGGFVSLVLLWSGLYALNDVMDWKVDSLHPVKKTRAIPSKRVSPQQALVFSSLLVFMAFVLALLFLQNFLFVATLTVMFFNQILYTLPPFEFKKRFLLDLFSGSLVNPLFRFLAGWVLFVPSFFPPLFATLAVVLLQLGGYTYYRLFSAFHDKKLRYASTVALLKEKSLKGFAMGALFSGFFFLALVFLANLYPFLKPFGFLPWHYLLSLLPSFFFLPSYLYAFKNPSQANLKELYLKFYYNFTLVALTFFLVFLFFR